MKFVTVATNDNEGLRLLKKSCDHFGIQLEVLGFGQPYFGNGTKITYLTEFLRKQAADEVVFFTDAYDSYFVRDVSTLEADFRSFEHPILFSSEDNYYFRIQGIPHLFWNRYYRWNYPKSESKFPKYRFLNSGGYMGYAGKILELFEASGIRKGMRSDQVNLHIHIVKHPEDIQLDYDHKIFTNYGKFAAPDRFTVTDDRLINNMTGTHPYIFHFPGPKHRGMYEYSKQFSFLK
ncbi:MAG: glycosyltransferase domain-containing protein [Bacteroidota bacterium]